MTLRRLAPAPPKASAFAVSPTVYHLQYDARDWNNEITLLDGRKVMDPWFGDLSLSSYGTMNEALDEGIEWTLKQLKNHIRTYDPPLNTEEEVDAEFDDWQKSSSEQGDTWSYTVSKGDAKLKVTASKRTEGQTFTFKFERMD